jgi:hypothetical protein
MGNVGRVQNPLEQRDLAMLLEKVFPRFLRFCCELLPIGLLNCSQSCMGLVWQLGGGKRDCGKNIFYFLKTCF